MEIEWPSPQPIKVKVNGRTLRISGEGLFDRNPDFVIYPSFITHWEDGTSITDEEKVEVLDNLVNEAAMRGWKFEIFW